MKHVTFTRDMAPYRAGEMRLVPDGVAADLEASGDIKPNPPVFPPHEESAAKPAQRPRVVRRSLGQTYLTK
jgi:hypothetical protein